MQNVRQTFVSKTNVVPKTIVCIKRFLNHLFIDKKIYALAPKNKLVCVLPFIGKNSLHLRSKLVKSVQNNLRFCHLEVVFQSPYKLHTLFCFKDTLDKKRQSRLKTNSQNLSKTKKYQILQHYENVIDEFANKVMTYFKIHISTIYSQFKGCVCYIMSKREHL